MTDADQGLDLEALLDPARLAAAWQLAHERTADVREPDDARARDGAEEDEADDDAFAAEATDAGAPEREPPLPIALAHQQFLDEIEHTLAAVPAIAARARRVLAAPLAQLAQALAPVELAAAEAAIDQLEDLWQALLTEAGWPRVPDRDEA